ncbi:Uncharacterized protein SCF082_LOCUS17996 [Durusdinium trenchii]|uniref:DUF7869 domain-containing protein n=1 Tax=Durusdinium trenchii TaxID=1381693 RepID=A0ABP0KL77_9DINO
MHCTRADLYWEYSAYAEARGLRVASQSTFYRVYWSFRSMSQTWFQNMMEENARLAAPSNVAMNVLCIIQDGVDQSKFRCPRVKPTQRQTKLFQKLFRPQLHVAACWSHGFSVDVSVADEDLPKNSETQLEQLVRAFDHVLAEVGSLPPGVNIQTDNTYREGKNQWTLSFGALTVALGVWRHYTASYLRVGHSHEDIDQYFSQIASLLARAEFSDPREVVDLLDASYRPDSLADLQRKQAKQSKVWTHAYKLDTVARWKDWTEVLGLRLLGLRRVGQVRFCLRKDCGASSYGSCQPEEVRGFAPHGSDVMAFCKRRMADPEPVRVLCAVPAAVSYSLRSCFQQPQGDAVRRPLGEKVKQNIPAKARACFRQKFITEDALAYLLGWVDGHLPRDPRPRSYPVLALRRFELDLRADDVPRAPGRWEKPARFRVRRILRPNPGEASDSDCDDAAVPVEDE